MEREPETFEALDLSIPKKKSADNTRPDESSNATNLPPSDDANSSGKLPTFRESQERAFPEGVLQRFRELKNDVDAFNMKDNDLEPPAKKPKMSLTSHNDECPQAAFTSRNADVDDACLRDGADSPPSVPFHIVNSHDAREIKRTCHGVSVSVHDENLWRAFANFGTEMIINRSGRRMFPHIILSMEGLHPQMMYSVTLEIVPADQQRYKFVHNQWVPIGMADPGPGVEPVSHPDSPNVGSFWMRNRASFSKVRLTNNKESSLKGSSDGNILLLSMHKYKVVIKIKEESSPSKTELTFDYDESAFIAVTAYQNSKITQLKIQNNPFAKAFRDCHNPSATQKTMSPRRRDVRLKDGIMSQLSVPNVPVQNKEFSPYLQYQALPFSQGGFSIAAAALDQVYRNNMGTISSNPPQYFPWASVGQHWPFQFWGRDQSLMAALYSNMRSSKTADKPCVYRTADQIRDRLCSENSQTSSQGSYHDSEGSGEERRS